MVMKNMILLEQYPCNFKINKYQNETDCKGQAGFGLLVVLKGKKWAILAFFWVKIETYLSKHVSLGFYKKWK
jgi:hypothetical protein